MKNFDKFIEEDYKPENVTSVDESTAPKLEEETTIDESTDIVDESTEEQLEEATKIAFLNDKLIKEKIAKSGLLPLLGDNNKPLNPDKNKFTQELSKALLGLYKKYGTLPIK